MSVFRVKKLFLFAIVSIFSLALVQAKPEISLGSITKNVLYLSSSEIQSSAGLEQIKQLTKAFPDDVRFIYRYVDPNFSSKHEEDLDELYILYKSLLSDMEIDLIVAADVFALNFVKQTQDELFKGITVLVLGMEKGEDFDQAQKMMRTHIIMDSPYIEENIKLINSLFPRRRKILFLGCDDAQKEDLQGVDFKFDIDSEFKNIAGMSLDDLKRYAMGLEKCSVLFLPSAFDLNEYPVKSEEALKVVASNCDNPIFVCHDINFGSGVLGGYFVSIEKIAKAGSMIFKNLGVYRIMSNTYGSSQPIEPSYFFDIEQMKRFNITKSSLNTKTIYINDKQDLIDGRNRFVTVLVICFLLLVAICILGFLFINQFKSMDRQLDEERSKLNAIISQSEALFWECYFDRDDDAIFLDDDDDGDISYTGDIAQGWIDSGIIPEEYLEKYNEMIGELKSGKETVSIDLPLLQEDIHTHLTTTRWKHIVYKIIEQKGGKVTKAIATAMDITSRKRAEEEYEGEMSYRSFVNKEYPAYTRLNLTSNVIMERMVNVAELNHSMPDTTADNELDAVIRISTTHGQNENLKSALTRKELLTMFMNGTRSKDWDFFYEFKSGIIRWFRLSVELTSNPHTNCIEANVYLRDITNTKIMSISKDSVLDEEVEYIYWLDLSTANCHFIHQAKNVSWLPADKDEVDYYSMIDTMLSDVVSAKDRDSVADFFALKYLTVKLKDKQAANCTFEIITDNLRIAIKQVHSYFLNGNQNIIVFICRDITDITLFEKLQNEKLSKAIELAEKANASKSDFL